MSTTEVVSAAFRQLVSMMNLDEMIETIHRPGGLMSHFSAQPWDEKVFKVGPARASGGFDASSGTWMAHVTKEGPVLALTPTVDVSRPGETISGARFWRCLIATIESECQAGHRERGRPRALAAADLPGDAETRRWDRRHFLKWTQAPAPGERKKARPGPSSVARQVYALFYQ